MSEQRKSDTHAGHVTPDDIADPTNHRQEDRLVEENDPRVPRASRDAHGVGSGKVPPDAEDHEYGSEEVGQSAGLDTSGAVARPAETNKPGASAKLDGTPGTPSTAGRGRGEKSY